MVDIKMTYNLEAQALKIYLAISHWLEERRTHFTFLPKRYGFATLPQWLFDDSKVQLFVQNNRETAEDLPWMVVHLPEHASLDDASAQIVKGFRAALWHEAMKLGLSEEDRVTFEKETYKGWREEFTALLAHIQNKLIENAESSETSVA